METPQKPIKKLDQNLSTAPHDHLEAQEQSPDQSQQHHTPINFDQEDDLKLQQIQADIETISQKLDTISYKMDQIQQKDSQFGKYPPEYLDLELNRARLRKKLIDLDFSHKEINYPRLYAKKKKQELYYQELQKQKQSKSKQNKKPSSLAESQNQEHHDSKKISTQFQHEAISQRDSEECEEQKSEEVKNFDNSAVNFNLSASQNPQSASIKKFELGKINQVESSQLVKKPQPKRFSYRYAYTDQKQRILEAQLKEERKLDRINRQISRYIDDKIVARNKYLSDQKLYYMDLEIYERYQRELYTIKLIHQAAQSRLSHDLWLENYLYKRQYEPSVYPYRAFW